MNKLVCTDDLQGMSEDVLICYKNVAVVVLIYIVNKSYVQVWEMWHLRN